MKNAVIVLALIAVAVCTCCERSSGPDDGIIAHERPMYPPIWEMPAWSPDGKTIACFCQGVYGIDSASGLYQIDFDKRGFYLMDRDGTNMRKACSYELGTPSWHPNGDSLAFSLFPYGGAIAKADTTMDSLIQLTEVDGYFYPDWSPDGKRIVFHKIFAPNAGLWIMDSDGANRKHLGLAYYPSWSPDGTKIACAGFGGLAVMDDSGMNIEVLAPNNGPDKICWSPAGEDIFFSGYGYLFKYSIESDSLIELDVCSAFPSANPDGDRIVYLHHCISWFSPQNGQLFVIDADGGNKHQITFSESRDSLIPN